ncbi:response regulator [Chitinasiproducens palmae]|uniref:response regulator n=1 Tax=Chitinasiproducens palmae TaxID=1770053 RepID=UPI001480E868|nr:response regulator [Chitinasiproducens palmae]
MIVEDDDSTRDALGAVFETAGMQPLFASDAEDGILLAESASPDAVICDIGLPGMDGYYFVQRLRDHELRNGLMPSVAIALTGAVSDVARLRSMAEGFDHFVEKPVRPEDLLGLLSHGLRKRRAG